MVILFEILYQRNVYAHRRKLVAEAEILLPSKNFLALIPFMTNHSIIKFSLLINEFRYLVKFVHYIKPPGTLDHFIIFLVDDDSDLSILLLNPKIHANLHKKIISTLDQKRVNKGQNQRGE